MTGLAFTLMIEPPTRTAQQKGECVRHGRIYHYVKPEVQEAEDVLRLALRPYKPPMPYDGPIRLTCTWQFQKGKTHKDGEWRITRPDTDNLQKMLKDCMTKEGFWIDDSRVCYEICKKKWASTPGLAIVIEPLEVFDLDNRTARDPVP